MANSNDQYIFQAKEILRTINSAGQDSYIVGEALRDLLVNREIEFVEIFTSLSRDNVINLFSRYNPTALDDYTITFKINDFRFVISSARPYEMQSSFKINAPRRHYSTSLMDFLERKMFSINTLAMGINNVVYDSFNGRPDLKKRIRMICEKPAVVFVSEPIRMLEAIRLVSELGYKLDPVLQRAIVSKSKCIRDANITDVARELAMILNGKYAKRAINLIYKTKLYKRIPLFKYELKELHDKYHKVDIETFMATSMVKTKTYVQEVGDIFPGELAFHMLVNLAIANPKGNYDIFTLFANGEEACVKANNINVSLGRSKRKERSIRKAYQDLPIKKTCDLAFKGQDMLELGLAISADFMESTLDDIIQKVLFKELENNYDAIKAYVEECVNKYHEETKDLVEEVPISDEEINSYEAPSNIEKDFSNGLFSEEDFKDNNGYGTYAVNPPVEEDNDPYEQFESLTREQHDLEKMVHDLEMDNLRKSLEIEIERKIKLNGVLDGLSGPLREQTYNTMRSVYYDILIVDDKYKKLREEK